MSSCTLCLLHNCCDQSTLLPVCPLAGMEWVPQLWLRGIPRRLLHTPQGKGFPDHRHCFYSLTETPQVCSKQVGAECASFLSQHLIRLIRSVAQEASILRETLNCTSAEKYYWVHMTGMGKDARVGLHMQILMHFPPWMRPVFGKCQPELKSRVSISGQANFKKKFFFLISWYDFKQIITTWYR